MWSGIVSGFAFSMAFVSFFCTFALHSKNLALAARSAVLV